MPSDNMQLADDIEVLLSSVEPSLQKEPADDTEFERIMLIYYAQKLIDAAQNKKFNITNIFVKCSVLTSMQDEIAEGTDVMQIFQS